MSTDLDPSDVLAVLDVLQEAGFYSENWRPLGRRLGVSSINLRDIERDHTRDGVKRCLEETVEAWISNGKNTWDVLADAVENTTGTAGVGRNVANKIRQQVGLGEKAAKVARAATDASASEVSTADTESSEEKKPETELHDYSILMEASRTGDVEMAQMILNHGANPNLTNSERWTALMAAANNGRYGTVDLLLERGANPDMQDHSGWTALMAAVFNHYDEVVLRILKAGATPHIQDNNKTNALLLAIARDNDERVVSALLDNKPDLDVQDSCGETALIFACKKGNLVLVKRLLSMGANPNICNKYNHYPSSVAMAKGEREILKVLLSNGADPNRGPAPSVMMANYMGSKEMADVLIDHGADPNPKNKSGVSAREVAKESGRDPQEAHSSESKGILQTTLQALAYIQEELRVGPLFEHPETEKKRQSYGWGLIGKVFRL